MIIRTRQRRVVFVLAFQALAWGASAYFAHSAYTGNRGIVAKNEVKRKTTEIGVQIAAAKEERQAWERRVSQIGGPEVDRDLLDERQRVMLGLAHKNDLVIQIYR
jgi:cell division protein FtsB